MLRFFRLIRQKLLSENKFSKYLIYAIGEIVLVVIGILIALQINNWNTNRINSNLEKSYITLIKEDLLKDVVSLEFQIQAMVEDSVHLEQISTRLSNPKANKDTLIKIARFEFDPWYNSNQTFNTNTYESLISTGKIEIMGTDIVTALKGLSELQNAYKDTQVTSDNVYIDAFKTYSKKYSFYNANNLIEGPLQDGLWTVDNTEHLLQDLNYLMGTKQVMFLNILTLRRELLQGTYNVINLLSEVEQND